MSIPSFSIDLIKELDSLYPDQCPSLSLSDREVWFKAGQRSVINRLLNMIQAQDEGLPNVFNNVP